MDQKPRRPRGHTELKRAAARSILTNGNASLPGVDGRSAIARRYTDIISIIVSDQGGIDRLAEARVQLIRRFAACAVLAESLEGKLARGEQIDISEHAQLTSSMVRVAQRIGINRRAKEILPTLEAYLENTTSAGDVA
jgi:hypothetical protein